MGQSKCAKSVGSDLITAPPEFENFKFLKISDEGALLILVKPSKNSSQEKEYKVNGTKIRIALEWLIANCPDYKHIKIDEEALKEYPVDTDHIQLPTVLEEGCSLCTVAR